jgi:hypothetical protein
MKLLKSTVVLFLLFIGIISIVSASSNVPKFKVIGQYTTSFSILVSQNTTKEQLRVLIYEFRNARKNNTLSSLIPGAAKGNRQLGVIWILIFSDPNLASVDKLRKFMDSSLKSTKDEQFDREYAKYIRAEYYYSALEE